MIGTETLPIILFDNLIDFFVFTRLIKSYGGRLQNQHKIQSISEYNWTPAKLTKNKCRNENVAHIGVIMDFIRG
jgi:hypothetical protein